MIPLIMEIAPAIGSIIILQKRRLFPHQDKKPALYPELTIIIPVYNSSQTLEACLDSVYNSDYPSRKITVYLVNNKTKDNSFEIYAKCQEKYPDMILHWMNAEQGKSRALNLALYNSEGKYIIHIDSDGVLEKTALRHMVERFESDPTINVMTGAICTNPAQIEEYPHGLSRLFRKLEFMEYAQAFLAGRNYASENDAIYTLSGAFSGFRKLAILKSWLYSTDTICEDTQITFQMKYVQKERVGISEKSIFFVDPIEDFDKLYTQRQRWQRGSLEVAKLFSNNGLSPLKIMKDVNVRTMMYDHTFAFPRMIWYIALICLMFMGFSVSTVGISMGLIILMYIIVGYFYFFSILGFLKEFKELRSYYRKQWWVLPLLPFFNFMVFFIRMAGIINTIGTDSAWKTTTLTDECKMVVSKIRSDFSVIGNKLKKAEHWLNEEEDEQAGPRERGNGWYIGWSLVYLLAILLGLLAYWVKSAYGIGLSELVATLIAPTKGTGSAVVIEILKFAVPVLAVLIGLYVGLSVFCQKRKNRRRAQNLLAALVTGCLIFSMGYTQVTYDVVGYLGSKIGVSMLYESEFVKAEAITVKPPEKRKNLIYIYLESMETTYASVSDGGRQNQNYIPNLTALAREHVSFTDKEAGQLGGFHCTVDTGITMGALFASTTGSAYGTDVTTQVSAGNYAQGITSLGDILQENGYQQEFLCGSDADFAGRKGYFKEHGAYRIFDLYTAREEQYIPSDYYEWWGYEDKYLFQIAKDEVLRMADKGQPFNLTMLTVDAHHIDGYVCDLCGDSYSSVTANVVACTDKQVAEFVEWCKKQEFYEDTLIVITGDHPRMDTSLVDGVSYYDRTIYNCFINPACEIQGEVSNRTFTTMDIYPTVLSAMGFTIEGNRLGLGTNLFADKKTLAEEMGFDKLDGELSKNTTFYKDYVTLKKDE